MPILVALALVLCVQPLWSLPPAIAKSSATAKASKPARAPGVVAAPVIIIPQNIRATLDEEYPGWTLAPVLPQIQQEFTKRQANRSPSFAVGDFDRNGEKDYGVQIILKSLGQEEQIITVFLARGGAYEENIVQSMGIDPTVYLWVTHQAKDALWVLGGAAGDSTYGYDEGKFHEMPQAEDPGHPDPSIPRFEVLREVPVGE